MARVLLTGCSTGIGRATADSLTDRGHEVVATARNLSTLDGLDVAQRVALDVDDARSIEAAMTVVGDVDVLVNNAGVGMGGPLESYPLDLAQAVFTTNVFGPLRLIQAVLPAMRERGSGVIVNVSSVEGVVSTPLYGIYSASKHALEALSESLHFEVGHFGVRVVIIEPGYIATAMRTKTSPIDIDATPYAELHRQWAGTDEKLLGGPRPGPDLVAHAIADAIDDPDTPLRVPVGEDAVMVTTARKQLDDVAFESTMRSTLQIDW
ncbi:MAG TPA: SDR family oxidoreductase [Acidimicrobiales bacterium]|nr:SDR family oxidoreductase [Acidimicrobiales bacterium]